jgi:hypothetical protein
VSGAVPDRHPDPDQLADLAAEVLPAEVARSVETHVRSCRLCAGLLADAERMRDLLFTDEPGPMPQDVWLRLEGALAAEAINRRRTANGVSGNSAGPGWFDPTPAGGVPPAAQGPTHPQAVRPGPYQPPPEGAPEPTPYPQPYSGGYAQPYAQPYDQPYEPYAQPYDQQQSQRDTHPPSGPATGHPVAYQDDQTTRAIPAVPPNAGHIAVTPPGTDPDRTLAVPTSPRPPIASQAPVAARPVTARPGAAPPPPPPPSMSFDEAPTAAWKAFLDEPEPAPPPQAAEPAPLRMGRVVRASVRSRRDVRTEDREAVRRRTPVLLAAAAAALVLVGGGATTLVLLRGQGDTNGDAGAADLPGTRRSTVSASGRDYTPTTLVDQVRELIRWPSPSTAGPSGGSASLRTPSTSPSGSSSAPAASSAVPTAGTVADPAQLQSCLVGLGDGDRKPLAVDLARWKGREAAVIVMPGRAGGFDIWVVSRQCTSGKETTLGYKHVAK